MRRAVIRLLAAPAALTLLLLLAAPSSAAAADEDRGPEVGSEAPAFTLPSITGDEVSLGELHDDGPAVVVFFRGAW